MANLMDPIDLTAMWDYQITILKFGPQMVYKRGEKC